MLENLKNKGILVHFILLCETFVKEHTKPMCKIKGYADYHEIRDKGKFGGVAIYYHNSLNVTELKSMSKFVEGEYENCFVEVNISQEKIILGELYRVPSSPEQAFIDRYTETIRELKKKLTKIS